MMLKFYSAVLIGLTLSSCSVYKYHAPTPNPVSFNGKDELVVHGNINSSGASVQSGYSFHDKFAVAAMYHRGRSNRYYSSEGEIALAYYTHKKAAALTVLGGVGFGNNHQFTDSTEQNFLYKGDFYRPFIQLNAGVSNGKIAGPVRIDFQFILKLSTFNYSGILLAENRNLRANYFLTEPGFNLGLGGKAFKFNILAAMPLRLAGSNWGENPVRTFPLTIGAGIGFYFNRKEVAVSP